MDPKSSWSNSVTLKSTRKKQHTYFTITSNFEDHWIMVSFQFISVAFPQKKKQTGDTPGPKPATLLAEFRGGTLNLETEEKNMWQFCSLYTLKCCCWLVVEPPHLKNMLVKLDSFLQVGVKNKIIFEATTLE